MHDVAIICVIKQRTCVFHRDVIKSDVGNVSRHLAPHCDPVPAPNDIVAEKNVTSRATVVSAVIVTA